MTRKRTGDKQFANLTFAQVERRRQRGQALNTKEFALLTGISYSLARRWFREPGFPAIHGVVFWDDFVEWRRTRTGLTDLKNPPRPEPPPPPPPYQTRAEWLASLPPRARSILEDP